MRKLTTKEFIEKARKKHGDNFIYDKVDYVKSNIDVLIGCKKCGNYFTQTPNNHLNGEGCSFCAHKELTTSDIIERIRKIHGDKYDTSLVEYKSTDEKIKLICHEKDEFGNEHGIFPVTPHALTSSKCGCPKCANKYSDKNRFVNLSNLKYNGLYTYDNFIYNGAFTESYITCKIHGDFLCSPNRHLNGQMCPKCVGSSMEREVSASLDINKIKHQMRVHFDWLNKQELDIFIPKYNVAIECQGEHHFKPIKLYGGDEEFEKIKRLDEQKRKLCEENGVKLLYYSNLGIKYPYQVFENKEELLKEIVK
jgi:hypothetical protein